MNGGSLARVVLIFLITACSSCSISPQTPSATLATTPAPATAASGYEPGGDFWTPSPEPTQRPYRLTSGDIPGVPIPLEAFALGPGVIESGYDQETYALRWPELRLIFFFNAHMPDEGFVKGQCGVFGGYTSCLFRKSGRNVTVEYRPDEGFALTEVR